MYDRPPGRVRTGDLILRLKLHRSFRAAAILGVVWLCVAGVATAPASGRIPPLNDNYIESLELNTPHMALNSVDTLKSVVDTAGATTQSNIFNPCGLSSCPPGPAEIRSCQGVSDGKTVWYDFYPQANGIVRIRTAGFPNVIALYTFNINPHSSLYLLPANRQCVPGTTFPSNELDAQVKKGVAYTFQIGGIDGAGGLLETLFDYFITPMHTVYATSTLSAQEVRGGIRLVALAVSTSPKAHVEVTCGSYCRPETKSGSATESFPHLDGLRLPDRARLTIRVTEKNSIGTFIQYTAAPGRVVFAKITRCTEPGSQTPRLRCH